VIKQQTSYDMRYTFARLGFLIVKECKCFAENEPPPPPPPPLAMMGKKRRWEGDFLFEFKM
jgi:hypothetical protein